MTFFILPFAVFPFRRHPFFPHLRQSAPAEHSAGALDTIVLYLLQTFVYFVAPLLLKKEAMS